MNQDAIYNYVKQLNSDIIGPLLVLVLLGAGIFFTIRLRFVPRYYLRTWKKVLGHTRNGEKASASSGMSPLQALSTAIASQVGTGNIVGVAMALLMGGPGSLFWMWVSAILGMSTNFAEAILGQLYKTRTADGHIVGGPSYYIQNGLHCKWLAHVFAIFFILALGMIGIMVQANSISTAMVTVLPGGVKATWVGVFLAVFVGLVLSGGITRIASFSEKVVPLMAGLFIASSLVYIVLHLGGLIPVFASIFKCAFTPQAGVGGAAGISVMSAVRYGVSRGLFSNEAGLGTTPHAHAIAKVHNSYEQGMLAIVGISVDLVICTLTGLVLLLSGVVRSGTSLVGIQLMQQAYHETFGIVGNFFVAISLFFFAMSTIVGWYFFAAQNVRYLFGEKPIKAYRVLVLVLVIVASVVEVPLVWELADTFNFFIVIPNVITLVYLAPKVVGEKNRMRDAVKLMKRLRAEQAAQEADGKDGKA